MTTTEQLREYLDAHGIDGAPTEPGWYVVRTVATVVVVVAAVSAGRLVYAAGRLVYAIGCEHSGRYLFSADIVRHAPFTIAPPAGRDLDAEVVAGVVQSRDGALRMKPGDDSVPVLVRNGVYMLAHEAPDDLRGLAGKVET